MLSFFLVFLQGDDEHKRPARMQPLNSESILTKEQLFDMFQQILGVKKFEHQILFNALMVCFVCKVLLLLFIAFLPFFFARKILIS